MGKTAIISSSLGAGICIRFKNRIRKTCAYVKRGASIDRIHKDLHLKNHSTPRRACLGRSSVGQQ